MTAPTFARRREQTIEHLRSAIPADAARAAEAIAAAVDRLDVVDLLRAAVHIAGLAELAATEEPADQHGAHQPDAAPAPDDLDQVQAILDRHGITTAAIEAQADAEQAAIAEGALTPIRRKT